MLSTLLVMLAIVTPAHGATVTTAQPVVTGTAQPGATVELSVGGALQGSAVADANGNWSRTVELPSVGENTIMATSGGEATQHVVTFRPPTSAPDVRPEPAATPAPAAPTTVDVVLGKTLKLPRTLAAGRYTFVVHDTSRTRGVRFQGRNTSARFVGTVRWTATLRAGTYRWTVTPTGRRAMLSVS
jgi:hypothetical protein